MIVVPPKVNEAYEAYSAGFWNMSTEMTYGCGHDAKEAYDRGLEEGRDAVRARRMAQPEEDAEDEVAALPGVTA